MLTPPAVQSYDVGLVGGTMKGSNGALGNAAWNRETPQMWVFFQIHLQHYNSNFILDILDLGLKLDYLNTKVTSK